MSDDEYFGDPNRVEVTRRAAELWTLLKSTGKYRYYGRAIGLNGPSDDTATEMAALARIQGVGICYYFPKIQAEALFSDLGQAGLITDRHEQYRGGQSAYEFAKQVLRNRALPEDVQIKRVDASSCAEFLKDLVHLCESQGVTSVPGSIMRGISIPGVVYSAVDAAGKPVASASSHQMVGPDFAHGTDVFWGALATRPDRRGEGLALYLGALVIKTMWEDFGARGFITGVRRDNRSSHRLCEKLGVVDTEWMLAQGIDPDVLGTRRFTK
ncbi:MAG: GNAT family N-acetyltransferase [Pseudomonadota bacterium]